KWPRTARFPTPPAKEQEVTEERMFLQKITKETKNAAAWYPSVFISSDFNRKEHKEHKEFLTENEGFVAVNPEVLTCDFAFSPKTEGHHAAEFLVSFVNFCESLCSLRSLRLKSSFSSFASVKEISEFSQKITKETKKSSEVSRPGILAGQSLVITARGFTATNSSFAVKTSSLCSLRSLWLKPSSLPSLRSLRLKSSFPPVKHLPTTNETRPSLPTNRCLERGGFVHRALHRRAQHRRAILARTWRAIQTAGL